MPTTTASLRDNSIRAKPQKCDFKVSFDGVCAAVHTVFRHVECCCSSRSTWLARMCDSLVVCGVLAMLAKESELQYAVTGVFG